MRTARYNPHLRNVRHTRCSVGGVLAHLGPVAWLLVWLAAGQPAWALSSGASQAAPPAPKQPTDGWTRLVDSFCTLGPLEKALFADAADGRLDEHGLFQAALVASGVENAGSLRAYERRFAALVEELRASGKVRGSDRRRTEAVFAFLHRRVLSAGYCLECTDLRIALDEGRFNCVSASVLFNCLAAELGLEVCALEAPGHAMSRVLLSEGPLDIETTCPRWFQCLDAPQQPRSVRETHESRPLTPEDRRALHARYLSPLTPEDRARARPVSPVELLAMIYYNRGVDLLGEKQFAAAAAANAKALRLDPTSKTSRANLLATLNNWAIALGSTRHYAAALRLLRQGIEADPGFETFAFNYAHVYHQWVGELCAAGRFQEAWELLDRAAAECPEQPYFRQAQSEVSRRWAESAAAERSLRREAPGP